MVAGGFSDLALHHHPAVQVTVGGHGPLAVTCDGDTHDDARLVVIASGARHAVRSDSESGALTLYLGLQTPQGVALNTRARNGAWVVDDGQNLVSCAGNSKEVRGEAVQEFRGRFWSGEWLLVLVPTSDPAADVLLQGLN